MNITYLRADNIYKKIIAAKMHKKDDIFRYELMKSFQGKWDCYSIPLKAACENGYDVIMACEMMGYLKPSKINDSVLDQVELLSQDSFIESCFQAVENALLFFESSGIELKVRDYLYTVLLANPDSVYTKLSNGCCGEGGIPGYILTSLVANQDTLKRMPATLAHECSHNVRFQFIKWSNAITLGEMMVSEGLAENFAVHFYGEGSIGPWVSRTGEKTLETLIKPRIRAALDISGLECLTAYLYGDEIAVEQGYDPVGLPFGAGYACGYYMIKKYLEKTGKSIAEATILPAVQILNEIEDFWFT